MQIKKGVSLLIHSYLQGVKDTLLQIRGEEGREGESYSLNISDVPLEGRQQVILLHPSQTHNEKEGKQEGFEVTMRLKYKAPNLSFFLWGMRSIVMLLIIRVVQSTYVACAQQVCSIFIRYFPSQFYHIIYAYLGLHFLKCPVFLRIWHVF